MVFDGCLFKSTQDLPGTALSLKQMRVILVLLTQSFLASLLIRQIILVIIMRSFICQTAQLILNGNKFRFFQRGCLLLVFVGFPESRFGLCPGQKSEKGFCRNSHVCNTEKNSTIDFIFLQRQWLWIRFVVLYKLRLWGEKCSSGIRRSTVLGKKKASNLL